LYILFYKSRPWRFVLDTNWCNKVGQLRAAGHCFSYGYINLTNRIKLNVISHDDYQKPNDWLIDYDGLEFYLTYKWWLRPSSLLNRTNQGRSYPKMKCTQICLKVWWSISQNLCSKVYLLLMKIGFPWDHF
jgi:hypothetical protein